MKSYVKYLFFFLLLFFFATCSEKDDVLKPDDKPKNYTEPTRITGSPYPKSSKPDTLYIIEDKYFGNDELIIIQSLQGILAQTKPMIYRVGAGSYPKWLNDLIQNYDVTAKYDYKDDFTGIIKHFISKIDGYILTELAQPSIHYAFSLSGLHKALVVPAAKEEEIKALGIGLSADVRNKTFNDFITNYGNEINKNIICYQLAGKSAFLSDYSVFAKSYYFYNNHYSPQTAKVFSQMNDNAVLLGWGTSEDQLVQVASKYSIIVDAADWALNLSTLSNIGVETKQKSHNNNPEVIQNVHTVTFLMTDGDNIQWTVGGFDDDPKWYGSKNRKQVNIGWTMSPALSELAPTVLKNFYDNAGAEIGSRDYFVAGPSGMGYIFPDKYSDLNNFAIKTAEYMKKADLKILNIIGTSMNEEYLLPFLQQEQIDAIFFYYYSSYVGGKGKIIWLNDKPVISGRYQLWGGVFDEPQRLADKINIMSTDITYSKAYSLIPVHVWTESVDDIIETISYFNENVRVVAPDEFVALINKNIKH